MFTNGLKMDLSLRAWDENFIKWKHWLSGKKKIPGKAVSKEGHADRLLGMKEPITIDSLEKKCNRNQCFVLTTPFHNFLFYWMIFVYITAMGWRTKFWTEYSISILHYLL